jgi:hypothetical protein
MKPPVLTYLWRSEGRLAIAPWKVVPACHAYDSSHAAWDIVIGKQGYHMAACASGKVKPPGDDAHYTTLDIAVRAMLYI